MTSCLKWRDLDLFVLHFNIFIISETIDKMSSLPKIKCYCDICSSSNNTCETDGVCFTSVTLEKGVETRQYR